MACAPTNTRNRCVQNILLVLQLFCSPVDIIATFSGFEDATAAAGVGGPPYGYGAAWADYDGDGHLDLYVTNDGSTGSTGTDVLYTDVLYRNKGDGTFEDTTAAALNGAAFFVAEEARLARKTKAAREAAAEARGEAKNVGHTGNGGRGVAWADYDGDGHVDLYVANDAGLFNARLYRNFGGSFQYLQAASGVGDGPWGGQVAAWADYNGDGAVDLYVADSLGGANKLYRNKGRGVNFSLFLSAVFEIATKAATVGTGYDVVAGDSGKCFGVAWADYDGDGHLDLTK